jgi:hypothetical protein
MTASGNNTVIRWYLSMQGVAGRKQEKQQTIHSLTAMRGRWKVKDGASQGKAANADMGLPPTATVEEVIRAMMSRAMLARLKSLKGERGGGGGAEDSPPAVADGSS